MSECYLNAGKFYRENHVSCQMSQIDQDWISSLIGYHIVTKNNHFTIEVYISACREYLDDVVVLGELVTLDIVVFLTQMMRVFSVFIDLMRVAFVYRMTWWKKKNQQFKQADEDINDKVCADISK